MPRETFSRQVDPFALLMLSASVALVCLVAFTVPVFSQLGQNPAHSNAGRMVDAFIRRKMAGEQIPGVQIAVLKNGKLIKTANYGVSNVELNTPVTPETTFEIASNSKQFTAGAILLLCEDKRLSLDDSVTKYTKSLPREYDAVTIRHLLNHTSGVKDYIEEFDLERRLDYTNQRLLERIGANKLNFAPGENARYSTTGYLLLGIVIENITDKPYGQFLQERVFGPLGMKHTRVIALTEIIPGRATGYVLEKGKLIHGRYVAQTLRSSADIGLMTTATDMARWDSALKYSSARSLNNCSASCRYQRDTACSMCAVSLSFTTDTNNSLPRRVAGAARELWLTRKVSRSPRKSISSPSTQRGTGGWRNCHPASFSTTQRAFSCNTLCNHLSEARTGTLTISPRSSMSRPMLRRLLLRFSV